MKPEQSQKKGMSWKEILDKFIKTIGDESPSNSTLKKWAAEFRRRRERMEDYERSGHPKEATMDENNDLMHSLIMCDRRSLHDIAGQTGMFGSSSVCLDQYLRNVQGLS